MNFIQEKVFIVLRKTLVTTKVKREIVGNAPYRRIQQQHIQSKSLGIATGFRITNKSRIAISSFHYRYLPSLLCNSPFGLLHHDRQSKRHKSFDTRRNDSDKESKPEIDPSLSESIAPLAKSDDNNNDRRRDAHVESELKISIPPFDHNNGAEQQHDVVGRNNNQLFMKHWIQQLQSIPNMITVSRIILIPIICYCIISHQVEFALIGCIYAAISDVLDGYFARKYPYMQTALGTYLDPLADKLLINALSLSLWVNGILPSALVLLWLLRDVLLMVATHRFVAQNTKPGMSVCDPVTVPIQVTPTTISKVNTAFQFITLTVGIMSIIPPTSIPLDAVILNSANNLIETPNWYNDQIPIGRMYISENVFPLLCWITGTTTILSSFSYWGHSAFVAASHAPTAKNK